MKDLISVQRVALLHPKVRDLFKNFIENVEATFSLTIRVAQGLRTFEEQQAIYDEGRKTPGKIVTYSPPGTSYHNYGLAIDIVPLVGGEPNWEFDFLVVKVNLRPSLDYYGITWGGDFPHKDVDHFENKLHYNWRYLLHLYNLGSFIPGTKYVNI